MTDDWFLFLEVPSIYSCEHCGKKYSSFIALEHHINCKHTVESDVICSLCGKVFSCKRFLNVHTKRVHTRSVYVQHIIMNLISRNMHMYTGVCIFIC